MPKHKLRVLLIGSLFTTMAASGMIMIGTAAVVGGPLMVLEEASRALNVNLAAVFSSQTPGRATAKGLTDKLLAERDVNAQVAIAQERRALLKSLMETNPAAVLSVVVPEATRAKLPPQVQALVEREAAVEGAVEVIYIHEKGDDHDAPNAGEEIDMHGHGKYEYSVQEGGKKVKLRFADEEPLLYTGSKMRAKGYRLDDDLAVLAAKDSGYTVLEATAPSGGTGAKKVGVVMVKFSNTTLTDLKTAADIKNIIFGLTAPSTKDYFRRASYGSLDISGALNAGGDVYGWVTIPSTNTGCIYSTFMNEADAEAAKIGFSKAKYDNVLYLLSGDTGCKWGGLASVGGTWALIAAPHYAVVAHEMLHNFGAHHSNSLNCTDTTGRVSLSNSCTHLEYGDPFGVLGSNSGHPNVFQKGRLGWLTSSQTQSVTTSGTYTVTPLESASGVKALRIPRGTDANGRPLYLYVSFRQPDAPYSFYDATHNIATGVSIHLAPDYSVVLQPKLIDATPETATYYDAAFTVGKRLFDPVTGVTITTTAVSSAGATVQVSFGAKACAPSAPGIVVAPSPQYGLAGGSATYNVTITNKDTVECAATDITVTPTLPGTDWLQSPTTLQERLAPGASVTRAVTVTSPSTAVGTNQIRQTAIKTLAPALTATYGSAYIVSNTAVTAPVVRVTAPASGAVLSGNKPQTISATASDPEGIANIVIAVDGTTLGSCPGLTSCSVKWSPGKYAPGAHTITATAVDNTTIRTSGTASITVKVQ